jgi:hypothetical protein
MNQRGYEGRREQFGLRDRELYGPYGDGRRGTYNGYGN